MVLIYLLSESNIFVLYLYFCVTPTIMAIITIMTINCSPSCFSQFLSRNHDVYADSPSGSNLAYDYPLRMATLYFLQRMQYHFIVGSKHTPNRCTLSSRLTGSILTPSTSFITVMNTEYNYCKLFPMIIVMI